LDCVPEKGASFELHFGNEQNSTLINEYGEIESTVVFIALTSSCEKAISMFSTSNENPLENNLYLSEDVSVLFESRSFNLGF